MVREENLTETLTLSKEYNSKELRRYNEIALIFTGNEVFYSYRTVIRRIGYIYIGKASVF